jgi:hypothetical protein
VNPLATAVLFMATLTPQASQSLPWVFPGDFRDRLHMSELVVAGTLLGTTQVGTEVVERTELASNLASFRIDRVFQGHAGREAILFKWFSLRVPTGGKGYGYSGPPLADFRPGKRYMVFLKRSRSGWEVAMPLYAIEEKLAAPPHAYVRDVSQAPIRQRYEELAKEMENTALAQPVPPPAMVGEAYGYFGSVFDLLGGCAAPFYRRFRSSPSTELRKAASEWLGLIRSRHLGCGKPFAQAVQ